MIWRFKKQYQDKKIGIKGFGLLDTQLELPSTIHKLSLMPEHIGLIRYIERAEEKQQHKQKSKKSAKFSNKQ
jgi:hypothetical protein